jgi:hypothetical protein
MPRLLPAFCALLMAAPAAAQDWTYASSEHFEVYTTGGDRTARDVIEHFEGVHAFFTQFLKLSPRTGPPTRLIVFSNDREFEPFRPNEAAHAFYQRGPDRDYIVMGSFTESANQLVAHEYSHLVFGRSGARYPLWLNEGLAEFFSTLTPNGDRMLIGLVPEGRLYYLREGGTGLMTLEALFTVGFASKEYNAAAHAGLFYSQSWALTHMLLTDERYRPALNVFLNMISAGTPSAAAVEQAFSRPLATVMRDLHGHVRRDHDRALVSGYTRPPRAGRQATRRADGFEAGLVTANLLAISPKRADEARAAYERLAAERPDDLQLAESRAYFERRRGQREAARAHLARAVELGSTTASVYVDYASLAPEKAPELLARALALEPEDLTIRLRYGSALLGAGRNAEALAALAQVRRVPQESAFQYFQLLANVYVRLNEIERAQAAAADAVKHAQPGAQADFAARLAKSINDYAESRAASEKVAAEMAAARSAPRAEGARSAPATSATNDASATTAAAVRLSPAIPEERVRIIVSGRIRNMVCGSGAPILEVATNDGTLRLLIDDGLKIQVVGLDSHTVDLQCGTQDVPIRVGYQPAIDSSRKTVGHVRLLDYRQ